jgi:CRP/FNR family cyclic AMP-dependent transcriptional regulator
MALAIFNSEPETPITNLTPSASQQSLTNMRWDSPVEILHLKEGETVYAEGDTPKGLYLVRTGAVKVSVNRPFTRGRMNSPEYISKVVGAGDLFGYKALIKGANQTEHAKALRPTEIFVYSREAIQSIMNGPNTMAKMLLSQMVKDMESKDAINQLHYLASVQERIAYQLVLLADKFGVQNQDGTHINLKLTRNELAQLAGTINESLSRHLTELKSDGVLELSGKEIIVKNRQALMQRSGNFR